MISRDTRKLTRSLILKKNLNDQIKLIVFSFGEALKANQIFKKSTKLI
jgi:hypothetical protein